MDYTYLVKSGKYSEDDLNAEQKAFLRGMRFARESMESAFALLFPEKPEGILERIEYETVENFMADATTCMKGDEDQAIVEFSDINAAEEAK